MRHVMKMPPDAEKEDVNRLAQYDLVCKVIKKILAKVLLKIQNEQTQPLDNEDKALIYELSATCSLLCNQCSYFEWSSLEVQQPSKHSRTKRTPQQKVIDYQVSTLFPSKSIQTFIAIIFRDMRESKKLMDVD